MLTFSSQHTFHGPEGCLNGKADKARAERETGPELVNGVALMFLSSGGSRLGLIDSQRQGCFCSPAQGPVLCLRMSWDVFCEELCSPGDP